MKVCLIQPPYSADFSKSDAYFQYYLDYLTQCDPSTDVIVLPESCDTPCYPSTKEENDLCVRRYAEPLRRKVEETAKRCGALIFYNGKCDEGHGLRNTTFAIDKTGTCVGKYYKQHLTPVESDVYKMDDGYTWEHEAPTVLEIDGIRYGFITCYDFYFYENCANIARQNVDILIGCSNQRTDTKTAIEMMSSFYAYNCNAYVLRASISMGEDASVGGCTLAANPRGEILVNMESRTGLCTVEIDPRDKYYKPAGYGNPPSAHYEYTEKGRRPWKYRNAGSAMVKHNRLMPYPRLCAHRGFNTVAPENSLPAFGAAIALGAEEIEFDIWPTKDGEIVSIHDNRIDRVSDGTGFVYEHTYEELLRYDFGAKHSEPYRGLRILTLEEILKKFAGQVIMNIHIKSPEEAEEDARRYFPADKEYAKQIVSLIDKYDARKYVYFATLSPSLLKALAEEAPDIERCCIFNFADKDCPEHFVDRALETGCTKIQLFKPYFNQATVDKAHENGILCNIFWADDPEEAVRYLKMGIDTVLTNDYNRVAEGVKKYWKEAK